MQRRRAAHSKSRNGCLTCKVRKIKCDETLPHCKRCLSSGRVCEGPTLTKFHFVNNQSEDAPQTPTPQPEIGLLTPPHSSAERRSFHCFTSQWMTFPHKTIDSAFWTVLIPQLAQTYDFVWDIAVALGILDEHVPYMSLTSTFDSRGLAGVLNDGHAQAIRHYNKAIASVRRLTEQDQLNDFVRILSYILFASVEFRQRNVKIGNDLIKLCGRILSKNLGLPDTRNGSAAGQAVNEVLVPFVLRRAVTVVTLGNGPSPRLVDDDEMNDMLGSILSSHPAHNRARLQLQQLIFDCFELVRLADFIPFMKDNHPDKVLIMFHRQTALQALLQWKESLVALCESMPENEVSWLQSYLIMYWTVCYISLGAFISIDEIGFDAYMDEFAEIVQHASIYIQHCSEASHGKMLSSIDPGVIPPLYFCATKCRDPQLRREALESIRRARQQTDQWAFIAPEQVVARLIAVEEREFLNPTLDSASAPGSRLPEERCRYAYVGVVNRPVAGGKLRRALELGRYADAEDGLRELTNDYVWLDGGDDGFIYV